MVASNANLDSINLKNENPSFKEVVNRVLQRFHMRKSGGSALQSINDNNDGVFKMDNDKTVMLGSKYISYQYHNYCNENGNCKPVLNKSKTTLNDTTQYNYKTTSKSTTSTTPTLSQTPTIKQQKSKQLNNNKKEILKKLRDDDEYKYDDMKIQSDSVAVRERKYKIKRSNKKKRIDERKSV